MSRVTIRKGIQKLIEEGLLFRRHGSGTYVSERIQARGATLTSFSEDARSRGDDPGVVWMMRAYASATDEEASALEVPAKTRVARLARVRLANGEPLAIEHAVVPAELLPDLDAVSVRASFRCPARSAFAPRWQRRPRPACCRLPKARRYCASSA